MRERVIAFLAILLLGLALLFGAEGPPAQAGSALDANICLDPEIRDQRDLRCPDLRMRPPFDLDEAVVGGKPVLRAANSIDSVGDGPAELRGFRSGDRTMDAVQRVYKRGGDRVRLETGAKLFFKSIPGQGRYWKFKNAAKFALYQLDNDGNRIRRVETGPKQSYCLRDLSHTRPGLDRSPDNPVYPACSQDASRRRVTLGTSVGWSDVYPSSYHEQWIELDDIPSRGCYSFVHIADPNNGVYEMNERNNAASTVIYVTRGGDYRPNRCQGVRDQSLPRSQATDDSRVPSYDGGGYQD